MSPERSPWIDDELVMLQGHVARFLAREFAPHVERREPCVKMRMVTVVRNGCLSLLHPGKRLCEWRSADRRWRRQLVISDAAMGLRSDQG